MPKIDPRLSEKFNVTKAKNFLTSFTHPEKDAVETHNCNAVPAALDDRSRELLALSQSLLGASLVTNIGYRCSKSKDLPLVIQVRPITYSNPSRTPGFVFSRGFKIDRLTSQRFVDVELKRFPCFLA